MGEDTKPQRTLSWRNWACSRDGCWKKAAVAETKAKRSLTPKGTKPRVEQTAPLPTRVPRGRIGSRIAIRVWIRDEGKCVHCQKELTPDTVTFDHVIPVSHGGRCYAKNLVLSCHRCNHRRGNKPLLKLQILKGKDIVNEEQIREAFEKSREIVATIRTGGECASQGAGGHADHDGGENGSPRAYHHCDQ